MSSFEVSLLQIPEIPMKHILEYLNFPSILVLRKVCHDLRNFIDDTKLASRLTDIYVKVFPKSIRLSVCFDQSISAGVLMRMQTGICYEKNGERCLVTCNKEEKIKETILENEDFVTVFCKDFDIVLRHQKTVLEGFKIYFTHLDSTVKERVLESVNKSLKSLNRPLQVKSMHMEVNNHNEILNILPYIDPKPLDLIHINEPLGKDNVVLNLDEIGQLEQWKQAKNLSLHRFQIPYLAENLKHFSSIDLGYRGISIEELILLKEIFPSSSTLNTIKMCYNYNYKGFIKQRLTETLGQPFVDNIQEKNWFFRIPDTNQFLKFKFDENHNIYFNRIEQSDVPQNVRISN